MSGGRLVVMGSGETAPTMVEVHRETLNAAGAGSSWLIDTPYGFQENADDITRKAVDYFRRSVGRTVTPVSWRARLEGADLDRALTAVRTGRSVFAGPGSPTYALQVWADSGFDEAVLALAAAGGTVTFASAAALTVGIVTVPVYEIYKCGHQPSWVEGLNLLERLTGLRAALIPHYDNAEGGTHSTSFCYLGERRLRMLEDSLPEGAHVIGVDEHTALVLDLATRTAKVLGNGGVTVRHQGSSRVLPAGTEVAFEELAARPTGAPTVIASATVVAAPAASASLRAEADAARASFDEAMTHRDGDGAAAAVLRLEQALADWSADSLQSSDTEHARRTLRGMVLELAGAAREGLADPAERMAPLVEGLLALRAAAREAGDYATSDRVRDQLAAAGVEVRDGPAGVEWVLSEREPR